MMSCCIAEWKCTVCGKSLSLQRTSGEGFFISVFENEDGSPRFVHDDTQARVVNLPKLENGYSLQHLTCWDCSQKQSET